MDKTNKKDERFELRLSKAHKAKLEKAAELLGHKTLAGFVTSTVLEKANEVIEKDQTVLANKQDKEVFFKALMEGPEPNEALHQAARDYEKSNTTP